MSTLKFARDLAQFEEYLDMLRANGGDLDSAAAASYKTLIAELVELDEHHQSAGMPGIPDILMRAMAVFRERQAASSQSQQERY